MKHISVLLLCLLLLAAGAYGQQRRPRYRSRQRTEADLVANVISCLQVGDTGRYYNLFPPFDTLWHMVLHNPDRSPEAQQELAMLKEHPQTLIDFDPRYNHDIISRFAYVLAKGEDSGLLWRSVVLQRYELLKDGLTRNLQGYDHIAPERFRGYVFLRDLTSRRTFCVTITEIQKLKGDFFGGQVMNILEAADIDDFLKKEDKEQKYLEWLETHPDTTAAADSAALVAKKDSLARAGADDDDDKKRKEVIGRKYYEGSFDNEIPVKLYVRYMKDIGGKTMSYDGLYKFGDQKKYLKLQITFNEEQHWIMEDEVPLGVMELVLKNETYTGNWSNNDENGYDVVLTTTPVAPKKIEQFDKILDEGASGKIDERMYSEAATTAKKKDDDVGEAPPTAARDKASSKAKKENDGDGDKEWQQEQDKAKRQEAKKMKRLNRPKEQDE